MKIDLSVFRSRLAHRILILFVICSVLPISVLAYIAYRQVVSDLNERAVRSLHQTTKTLVLSLYDEIVSAEDQLRSLAQLAANGVDPRRGGALLSGHRVERIELLSREEGVRLLQADGRQAGEVGRLLAGLTQGNSVLVTVPNDDAPRVMLLHSVAPEAGSMPLAAAELRSDYLWGEPGTSMVPAGVELCLFDSSMRLLHGSFSGCEEIGERLGPPDGSQISGTFDLPADNTEYLVSFRRLFLEARFATHEWTVVLCQPRADVFAPAARFKTLFPPAVLTAIWLVLLASIFALRRVFGPLDVLKEGTTEVAHRNFAWRANITSGDELEDLGTAFDGMAARLDGQFRTQAMLGALHRAILSSLDANQILRTAVIGGVQTLGVDLASLAIPTETADETVQLYSSRASEDQVSVDSVDRLPRSIAGVREVRIGPGMGEDDADLVAFFDPGWTMTTVIAASLSLPGDQSGVLCLGWKDRSHTDRLTTDQVRLLGDQLEVALTNANLLAEIESLMWGTLEALARAVDAKSPWTAGHSERVTRLAVAVAREIGLPPGTITIVRSGALLHDIGKIGVDIDILDKTGGLDQNELGAIRSHTLVGERILEPIHQFREILPMVSQHHERLDGSGYPAGLRGTEIDLKARILAVVDVYDAMTADRPYRTARSHEEAIRTVTEGSGREFDPEVVVAFLRVIGQQRRAASRTPLPAEPRTAAHRPDTSGMSEEGRS